MKFGDLEGWAADDHAAALSAFRRSARLLVRDGVKPKALSGQGLGRAAKQALEWTRGARAFFETAFRPVEFGAGEAHLTGYFEPVLEASRVRKGRFQVPLLRRPDDLTERRGASLAPGVPEDVRYGRMIDGRLHAFEDRATIETCIDRKEFDDTNALAWVADPVDAYFVHVQGAAHLRFEDGSSMNVTFDGKSGHAYTSIGRLLSEQLDVSRETMTADRLQDWLRANPAEAAELMRRNRSYIFFRTVDEPRVADDGPVAAGKVRLTAGRSLAVDRNLHGFGLPVWIDPKAPDVRARLTVAQDTGSAIVGPGRADLYVGSGVEAGLVAGRINTPTRFVGLVPA